MQPLPDLLENHFRSYAVFEEALEPLIKATFFASNDRPDLKRGLKVGDRLVPVKVRKVRLLPPACSEEHCFLARSAYRRPILLDVGIEREDYSEVLLGAVPALTSRGSLLFGNQPVRERVAVAQLLPRNEVRLARVLSGAALSQRQRAVVLEKYNRRHGTYWTQEGLKKADRSADLRNYHLRSLADLLETSIQVALRRIKGHFWSFPISSPTDLGAFLLPCLPQMFTSLLERHLLGSGLIQLLDKTNALAEIAHKRKVTFCGSGGVGNLHSDKIPERTIHRSFRGSLCPVETTESARIGLNLHLALGATLDEGRIVAGLKQPLDTLGASVGLIPFVEHDDMNRAMMGAKNMKQALPLLNPEPPLVKTGLELNVGRESRQCLVAPKCGQVLVVSESALEVHYDGDLQACSLPLITIPGTHPGIGSFHALRRGQGQVLAAGARFESGDVLADSSTTVDGELALGVNLLVAYMPWYGYNFEDAIVVSRRLVDEDALTSLHLEDQAGVPTLIARRLEVGDKLSGRHGNKGVVSLILEQEKMPALADGTPVDLILNPQGIISRMNIGQLLETHWGWVAKANRQPYLAAPFSNAGDPQALMRALKECAMPDGKLTVTWINAQGDKCSSRVVVGYQYLMKLNHCATDKLHARGRGNHTSVTRQPTRGKRLGGGQRIGEMEVWALRAHRAHCNLGELLGAKSDVRVLPAQSSHEQAVECLPGSLQAFLLYLRAMGIYGRLIACDGQDTREVTIDGPQAVWHRSQLRRVEFRIASDADVRRWGGDRAITEASYVETAYCCQDCDFVAREGGWQSGGGRSGPRRCPQCGGNRVEAGLDWHQDGLMGRNAFGPAEAQERWNGAYIQLPESVPHPLFPEQRLLTVYVLPPALRPFLPTDEGLNRHYREILIACRRLVNSGGGAGSHDWRELVRAVGRLFGRKALFPHSGRVEFRRSGSNEWRRSLVARLEGKAGLVRAHLLGKRVDFSGRAVIVPDPSLPFGRCRIPRKVAATWSTEPDQAVPWTGRPVLLNRAPSLHRYSFLSFELDDKQPFWDAPVLAIHPLICAGFGADFDGDTMAIHLPLHQAAIDEARTRLAPRGHLFSVAHGGLLLHAVQDIAAGIYLLTRSDSGRQWLAGLLGDSAITERGRPLPCSGLRDVLGGYLRQATDRGPEALARALERVDVLMGRAFQEVTEHGLSFSMSDLCQLLPSPDQRRQADRESRADPKVLSKRLAEDLERDLLQRPSDDAVAVLMLSGARGDPQQLAKLCRTVLGVRSGAMSSCYVEGLSSDEYFCAAQQAREILKPKKLGTPKGGDLMRKLIFGLYPVQIVSERCAAVGGVRVPRALFGHLTGKYAAQELDGIVGHGELVGRDVSAKLLRSAAQTFSVFSPLGCQADGGVCARCYGWDLSTGKRPEQGLPIGILAAQSIGERATQDFMRVFHGIQADVLNKVSEAKALMESGRIPRDVGDDPTPSKLLAWLTEAYADKVNMRHFEVVLRAMNTHEGWRGLVHTVGQRKAQHPLATAAFRSPVNVLAEAAAQNLKDPLEIEPALLITDGGEGER